MSDKFKRVLENFQILVDPFPENETRCNTFGHAMLCYLQCQSDDITYKGTCLSNMCNASRDQENLCNGFQCNLGEEELLCDCADSLMEPLAQCGTCISGTMLINDECTHVK